MPIIICQNTVYYPKSTTTDGCINNVSRHLKNNCSSYFVILGDILYDMVGLFLNSARRREIEITFLGGKLCTKVQLSALLF